MTSSDDLAALGEALEDVTGTSAPDHERRLALLEQVLAHPDSGEYFDLPGVAYERAETLSLLGRHDAAIAAMREAIELGWDPVPDARCDIASLLVRAGRVDEAYALHDEVAADTPDDVWLYNSAGMDCRDAGDHERAVEWFARGLRIALDSGDPEGVAAQLADLRRTSLEALGRPVDALDAEAERFLARPQPRAPVAPATAAERPSVATIFGWFPADQFDAAVAAWPELMESWGATHHAEYRRMLEARLKTFNAGGLRPRLARLRIPDLRAWAAGQDLDPGSSEARAGFAAELGRRGEADRWPPGRNEPCWCGSGRKYKKCCGPVPPSATG